MVTNQWPAEGVHLGLDPSVYFAAPPANVEERIVSKSLLWQFFKNPKRWLEGPEITVTDAMKWGSLIDCLLLTPDRFKDAYRVQPAVYLSKESAKKDAPMVEKPWNCNSNTCKAWRDELPAGVEVISTFMLADAEKAVRKLCARPEIASMMSGAARTQVAMRYDFNELIHEISGFTVRSKSLIDIVPDKAGKWGNALCDLKMFAKLNDMEAVEKEIYSRGYHGQAALYLDTWNALTGEDRERFVFCFQLSTAPYEVAIVELDADAIMAGREWYLAAIKKWARTVTTGEWTSPWDGIKTAKLPKWAGRKVAA